MLPNEDQNAIAEMARQFAQERLKPFAEQWSREHRYPAEAIAEMAALGFFGMLVPEQWGGSERCAPLEVAATPATWPMPWHWKRSPPVTAPARPS